MPIDADQLPRPANERRSIGLVDHRQPMDEMARPERPIRLFNSRTRCVVNVQICDPTYRCAADQPRDAPKSLHSWNLH